MEPPAEGLADELLEQLTRLEGLLARMAESRWALAMVRCREEVVRRRDDSLPDAARLILTMFGGMGSLNDVILYRDERFVRAENDEIPEAKGTPVGAGQGCGERSGCFAAGERTAGSEVTDRGKLSPAESWDF